MGSPSHKHKARRAQSQVELNRRKLKGSDDRQASSTVVRKSKPISRPDESLEPFDASRHGSRLFMVALFLVPILLWMYWPTLVWMETQWRTEPDYSHGYLVLPLAGLILYARRDSFPGFRSRISWMGLGLLLVAGALRVIGRMTYMDFVDGWSLLPWVGGVVWLLAGPKALRWSLPAIAFLFLLVPLPYQAESMLSWRLQGVATAASTAILRILGQPAVNEGHTIWIGETRLLVEEACSGLRIFVGMGALAFFWAAMVQRSWIDRVIILAAALPLAILANSFRITVTGFLFQWFDGVAAHRIHDFTGYLMIPLSALMLWGVKKYWELLYRPVEVFSTRQALHV